MIKNIKEFMVGCLQSIHAKTTSIIYIRGLKKLQKKEKKEQARYEKACSRFNYIINPFDTPERYLAMTGLMYRVVFEPSGIRITDEHDNDVECKLKRLEVLEKLSKEIV